MARNGEILRWKGGGIERGKETDEEIELEEKSRMEALKDEGLGGQGG